MFKKSTIIIGLILLLVVGILASLGWAEWQKAGRKGENQTGIQTVTEGTQVVEDRETKKMTDEEFVNKISEIANPIWRIFYYDFQNDIKKGSGKWNPSFKKLMEVELNLTPEQFEETRKFLEIAGIVNIIENDIKYKEYLLSRSSVKDKEQLSKEVALLKEEYLEKKYKAVSLIPQVRRILKNKEEELLEWFDEISDLYMGLTATPRPKSEEELNSLKNEFFQSEGYKKELERKVNERLLKLKTLNLTSSQQAEIRNILRDSIKKIDELKSQLCALQYVPCIKKSEGKIIEDLIQLINLRDSRIKTYLTKEQKLKFEQIK